MNTRPWLRGTIALPVMPHLVETIMNFLVPSMCLVLLPIVSPQAVHACDMIPTPGISGSSVGSTGQSPPETTALSPVAETIPLAPVADYAVLAQEGGIPQEIRLKVRATPTAMMHAPGRSALAQGLGELATSDPQGHGYAVQLLPSRDWYHSHGGMGYYSVGSATRPDAMIDGLSKRVDGEALGDSTKAMFLDFDSRSIPDGTHAEFAYKQYTTTMDVDVSRVRLQGVYTQVLTAPRIIVTGNASFFAGFVHYPLELPNVAVDNIATTVRAPSGAVPDDGDGPTLSVRDPRMVFTRYQEALATIEKSHPDLVMVYATVPLATSGNYQRNFFNESMRSWCKANHQPLLDVASLLSVDRSGAVTQDAQGPRLSPDLVDVRNQGLNAVARERLARAWWWMMARIDGWTPPT